MSAYLGFEPMPGRVLVRPDEGRAQIGGVFLCDSARRFDGFRSGVVLAVGAPVLDGEAVDLPEVGEVVHYERNRPPPHQDHGVRLGGETLVLLWADQVLCREVLA